MFSLTCTGHVPAFPSLIYSPNILAVAYATDVMQNNKIIMTGAHLEIIGFFTVSEIN